jgi:cellulose synthase/poly-beta-1,6-N-acetylglucosamine synthase-like glycosyltransferase
MTIQQVAQGILYLYAAVLTVLCVYGLHRYFLVAMFLRVKRRTPPSPATMADLPRVTVQLPMYNEEWVARRIIEQTCRLDYPRDRLEIQVLDDSTDATRDIARNTVEQMRAAGHDIVYIRRENRHGYKAGALEEGLRQAKGDFIAIFDADFLPPPQMLRETIHYFSDPEVGMVQTRWDHLNRDLSLLTQAQAVLLDGHFVIEHTARNRSGRYMSFNGTAGIWRKQAITDAGGWQHDTLTEDLDLSYRAQIRGWRFVFLPGLTSPAELPPEMNAFKAQQHRWTKGGAQTCLKLLPQVLRGRAGWRVKLEAFFHLTSCAVYVLMVLLSLLLGPALWAKLILNQPSSGGWLLFEMFLFLVGFGSATVFYVCAQWHVDPSAWRSVRYIPALMAVGMGIAFNNAIAALEGFFGRTGEFVRTPKFGDAARQPHWRKRMSGLRLRARWQAWAELIIGIYLTFCLISLFTFDNWFKQVSAAIPFLLIFIIGYFYVAIQTFYSQWVASRPGTGAAAAT